jgi:alpha-L-arabinofuranosidase
MRSEIDAPVLPQHAEVRYHIEVAFRVAVTPFVARQNANVFLLMNVGNMLSAGEPVLSLSDPPHWKVPVFCAFPEFNRREKIGDLAVDVDSGAILLEESYPSSVEAIDRHAQLAYDTLAASSSGA